MNKVMVINKIRYDLIRYEEFLRDVGVEYHFVGVQKYAKDVPVAWRERCASFTIADELTVELLDLVIRSIGGIDRLICFSEEDLHLASVVRAIHGVQGARPDEIIRFRDKTVMKAAATGSGVAMPEHVALPRLRQDGRWSFNAIAARLGTPFVLKPRLGMACMGVFIVGNEHEFEAALATEDVSPAIYAAERYVEGRMYHVDSFVVGGAVREAFVTAYTTPPINFLNEPMGGVLQLDEACPLRHQLLDANAKVITRMAPPDGCTHAEFFITASGEVLFCEIGARFGGTNVVRMIEVATGRNLAQMWFMHELGLPWEIKPPLAAAAGYLDLPTPSRAVIRAVSRATELYPWVDSEEVRVWPGMVVGDGPHMMNRMASYVVTGASSEEVRKRFAAIVAHPPILWEPKS